MVRLPILLADAHEIVRLGLRSFLASNESVEIVGEASSGQSTLMACEALRPDILVTELTLPGLSGLQVIARLAETHPSLRVLVHTSRDDEGSVRSAFSAGASGYVLKQSDRLALVTSIAAIVRGDTYVDPRLPISFRIKTSNTAPPAELSQREQQVIALVAMGYSNKAIAAITSLSVKTVETCRARVAEKLGLSSRHAVVRYALERGWLSDLLSGA